MLESGVLLDNRGQAIYYHTPQGRDGGSLPDSLKLWNVIWENRNNISGIAHSHPGSGDTGPSWIDITTFSGIEKGLWKRLDWWITSSNKLFLVKFTGPNKYDYQTLPVNAEPDWVDHLRELSGYYS